MALNLGKSFEQQFKKDVQTIAQCFVYRLPDQQSGYFGTSANPCDFLVFRQPYFYLVEVKSIQGNTFNFANLRQYSKLKSIKCVNGMFKYVVIWFRDHDRIIAIQIDEITKMMADDKKSINITTIDSEKYEFIEVPTIKKRVFLTGDYSVIFRGNDKRKKQ